MRVVSGKYRGLKLSEFAGGEVRPTADRVKESLFNILGVAVAGARVLDLFCGSGSLGIECLSRGAKSVCFNDVSQDSLNILKKNLARLSGAEGVKITRLDFSACLCGGERYDIIFIDPPYASDFGLRALEIIGERKLLNKGGVAVFERDKSFAGSVSGLKLTDERKYGRTFLTFFEGYEGDKEDEEN